MTGKRIILASLGSSGDVHPYIALAKGLRARGHDAVVASHPTMRFKILTAGVGFFPLRPDAFATRAGSTMVENLSHPVWGDVRVRRHFLLPNLGATFEDLKTAVRDADLLITSPTILPAGLIAATTKIPWISAFHTPTLFASLENRAAANLLPRTARWRRFSGMARPLVARAIKPAVFPAEFPLHALWRRHGLEYRRGCGPDQQFSSSLVLGLFSAAFATPERHWPLHARVTGFLFYDGTLAGATREDQVEEFIAEGEPPLVFALGSTSHEQLFFRDSLEAAVRLKRRALFLIGGHRRDVLPQSLPPGMMVAAQVPYSTVFPHACINIHHGGIGTTALAMQAGRPMLVVPRAFDQPDNAARIETAGSGRTLSRLRYNAPRAAAEIGLLLNDTRYQSRAAELRERIQAEDGIGAACDAIEDFFRSVLA